MIEKIDIGYDSPCRLRQEYGQKINEVIDAVNGILDYAPLEMAMKAGPKTRAEKVQQVSYMAPGDITVFHGFNCSVEFDTPLPEGTRITIKSITKGGDNE